MDHVRIADLAWLILIPGARGGVAQDVGRADPGKAVSAESIAKALAEFRRACKEDPSIDSRAEALRRLASGDSGDRRILRILARYLAPTSRDRDFVLPRTSAELLGGVRGDRTAGRILAGALGIYRKVPAMEASIAASMGRNGHESLIPHLIGLMRKMTTKPQAAVAAASALGEMPAEIAVAPVLREWGELGRRFYKEAAWPGVSAALLTTMKKLTGEGYATVGEFQAWWAANASRFTRRSRRSGM